MLLQLLLSPKNTVCLDDSSEDKSGTSIHLPAGAKDSSGGQCRADHLVYLKLCNKDFGETSCWLLYVKAHLLKLHAFILL